ncbi:MAG: hypothetical protein MUF85_03485, partial [Patescibacteria group bacterium]|nr:hypothetical protein [Patescibacteria group bacterium]
ILSAYTLQDSMSPDNLLSLSKLLFPEIARILELEIGHRVIFISPLDGLITRGEVSETPTIVGLSSNPTNLPATGRDICPNISLKIGHQDINLGNHGSIIGLITDKETAVERLETLAKKVSTKDAVAFFELLDAIKLVFSDDSIADESEFIGLSGVVKSNIVENLLDSPSDINQDDQPEGKPWGIMKPNIDFNPRLYRVIESHLPDLFALIQQGITSYLSSRSHGLDYGSNDSVFRFIQSEIMIEEGISDMSGLKEETLNFLGERISQRTERYRLGKFYNPIKTTLP